MSLNIEDSQLE